MSEVEVFLDDGPGEVRGILVRNGRYERLILQRESDPPQHRLGAHIVGRICEVDAGYRAAFVDMGCEGRAGFMPLGKTERFRVGDAVEVKVTAEPREDKGPTLRRLGAGEGQPRLVRPGPDVRTQLAALAPGLVPVIGAAAIRASLEAEEDALATTALFPQFGLDVAVERTRALIAVDIDYAHAAGRDVRKGRAEANRNGLIQAARMIGLRGWGGLVAIDLVGTAFDPAAIAAWARDAFARSAPTLGPVSRFGLLQLALPWTTRPIEEVLMGQGGRRASTTRAIDLMRALRLSLLEDTASPRHTARCAPEDAAAASPLVTRLGPRAAVRADPSVAVGRFMIERS